MRLLKRNPKQKEPKTRRNYVEEASRTRRMRFLLQRMVLVTSLMLVIGLAGFSIWFVYSGEAEKTKIRLHAWLDEVSVDMGLTLQNVYLEGQKQTESDEILSSLQVNIGQPLLRVPIQDIRDRLEQLVWVDYAVVSLQYPHTLHVQIIEKNPVAIWQNAGQLYLIDRKGDMIVEDNVQDFKELIVLVGNEAPFYTENFMQMIHSEPELAKRVASGVRVGERRWDVHFINGVEVKLPEKNPIDAWHFLYQLQEQYKVLDDGRKVIDLRVEDKVYIQNSSGDNENAQTSDRI